MDETFNENLSDAAKQEEKKSGPMLELVLFLILGFLVGVAVKTEAAKRITIGFNDYQMKTYPRSYDVNRLQADQLEKKVRAAENQTGTEGSAAAGSCGN